MEDAKCKKLVRDLEFSEIEHNFDSIFADLNKKFSKISVARNNICLKGLITKLK